MPRAAAGAIAHEVALDLDDPGFSEAIVLERGGLRVTMFAVDHSPVRPAVGYRFDYGGRSVVVTGDTKKSASVAKHAAGTDLLVHEALLPEAALRASAIAARLGNARLAKLASDIPGYHTSPIEAAEVAKAAGAKKLVLTHLVPGPSNFLTRRMFLRGVSDVYAGEVVLGEDEMRFDPRAALRRAASSRQRPTRPGSRVRSLVRFLWCASSVPPPISSSFASRHSRSTTYSPM